ncbi:MAG: prepilin-type N-terminal cleavage/methylation domain-containing protein [Phycisphaeraceae bacterium]|nr:prepilin-type N-terminal cleavage/methylation domain-containing protein [Phycisphaeraceae bacterium]
MPTRPATAHSSDLNSKGFTLIELLVVISIIALLLAILLPALQRSRETAKQLQCLSNQRSIATAALAYEADENRLPAHFLEMRGAIAGWPSSFTSTSATEDSRLLWQRYIGNVNFFTCPFLPQWDMSFAKFPVGSRRIYSNYNVYCGYYANRENNTWAALPWTKSHEIWTLDGQKMNVLVSDQVWDQTGNKYRVNHQPLAPLPLIDGSNGTSWVAVFYEGISATDARADLVQCYGFVDGSAAAYKGADEKLIDVPMRGYDNITQRLPTRR